MSAADWYGQARRPFPARGDVHDEIDAARVAAREPKR
jgi:hypothetical protein